VKLDPDLKLELLEKAGIYSNRLSIDEPKIVFKTKEVLAMPKQITEGRRTTAYKYYGITYLDHNLVFLNIRKIPDEKTIEGVMPNSISLSVVASPTVITRES